VGHFIILFASFQVFSRLRWREDLAQLMPFNRKLPWVQSRFTVLTIIAFGTLTLILHQGSSGVGTGLLHRLVLDITHHG